MHFILPPSNLYLLLKEQKKKGKEKLNPWPTRSMRLYSLPDSNSHLSRALTPSPHLLLLLLQLPVNPRRKITPMGKKLRLVTSFFSRMARASRFPSSPPYSWPWPYSCKHPETLSFRKEEANSSSCLSSAADDVEEVIRGVLKSDGRLFFEPAGDTRSMVSSSVLRTTTTTATTTVPFVGGVAVAVDSVDPYLDFKASMEEMVTARGAGVEDWEWMEEMLVWYLKINEKRTHGVIVGAFRDLVLSLACNNTSSTSSPPPRSSSFTFEEEDADCLVFSPSLSM